MGAACSALIAMTVRSSAMWLKTLRVAGVDLSIRARLKSAAQLTIKAAE
jgi:hypothetical protein